MVAANPTGVPDAAGRAAAPAGGAAARALPGFWERYGEVVSSRDFLFALLTAVLTLGSWGLSLAGAPAGAVTLLGVAGALTGGLPIAAGAVRGLIRREVNVDELVTIAIAAAILVGEYWGAALVAFMMLFGKVLEDVTAARAQHALEGLGQLLPALARVKDAAAPGGERSLAVGDVRVGDFVLVRPGERLPVDGEVVAGRAAVEQAAITGEPLPVDKVAGDEVFAGTLASGGALEVRTVRTGRATALGRIADLVREAEAERAPVVRTADRWARWFTPAVLLLAGLVYLLTRDLLPAVTVLVVACPCALVLATPTAVVAGIARAARRGILVKDGARLEAAGQVTAVCLDKTGTLTRGQPRVQQVIALDASGEDALLARAAGAERLSEHPLAGAVLAAAGERGLTVPAVDAGTFRAFAGAGVAARVEGTPGEVLVGRPELFAREGVPWPEAAGAALETLEAAGQTPLAVAVDGRVTGVIGVADAPREEAAEAVRWLRSAGVRRVLLLTGDREAAARSVAAAVGIAPEDVFARLLPEDKVTLVKRLRAEGHKVAMVGDGVNDAPALAAADVAIAMGAAGTDLAMDAADVVLMTDDVRQAAAAIVLSRKTLGTIHQNLTFAAVWNVVAVALAAFGIVGPVAGALVHNFGSVAVVVNAARLVNARLDRPRARS
jgi:Cd2+/Zn2+-exporting ATPase